MRTLTTSLLTREAFAPFGNVIEVHPDNTQLAINYGRTTRHHAVAEVATSGPDDRAILSIFRSEPVSLPFQLQVMERHPRGSQAFMPLSGAPYLVVVAPAGDFDAAGLRAFLASGSQGVNYHAGTWHHYSLAMERTSDFLVADRDGPGNNCDEINLEPHVMLALGEH